MLSAGSEFVEMCRQSFMLIISSACTSKSDLMLSISSGMTSVVVGVVVSSSCDGGITDGVCLLVDGVGVGVVLFCPRSFNVVVHEIMSFWSKFVFGILNEVSELFGTGENGRFLL